MSMDSKVQDSLRLASSLDSQLACVGARGWGKLEEVCAMCAGSVLDGGKVELWAVKMMSEAMTACSDVQLTQNCLTWKTTLIRALQACSGAVELRELCAAVTCLVCRAHQLALKEFSVSSLLAPLLRFQETGPSLQAAVLPCLTAIHHLFPAACKPHRAVLLHWGKDGLVNFDLSLCRESARLLAVMHSSPEQWTPLLTSSLSILSSSLLHYSHTLTQTTPMADTVTLDLPLSEPGRTIQLMRLITSHCRLLSYLLLTPPPSLLTLPLSTMVGVVSFGLHTNVQQVVTMATDSTLLITTLPTVHSPLLTLLHSLLTSTHTHLLPFTTIIDTVLLCQMGNEGGVVWRRCLHSAVCAWVRVRGEGGVGDKLSSVLMRWLLQSCQRDNGTEEEAMRTLCVVMEHCKTTIASHTAQLVWQTALSVLRKTQSVAVALAGVKLLRQCLEYPDSILLSTAIRVFQRYTNHTNSEVCDESRRGLSSCSVLLHPVGPPWYSGASTGGTRENSEPFSASFHVPHDQLTSVTITERTPEQAGTDLPPQTGVPLAEGRQMEVCAAGSSRKRRYDERGTAVLPEPNPQTEPWLGANRENVGPVESVTHTSRSVQNDVTGHTATVGSTEEDRESSGCGEVMAGEEVCSEEGTSGAVEVCGETREPQVSSEDGECGEARECGESGECGAVGAREDGVEVDSEDSDVDDIIASFCSSPSGTDSDCS